MATSPRSAPGSPSPVARPGGRLHIHGIKEMPAGYDAEVADLFRDLRAASGMSETDLAAQLATRLEVVQALEQGAIYALPPWPETYRVISTTARCSTWMSVRFCGASISSSKPASSSWAKADAGRSLHGPAAGWHARRLCAAGAGEPAPAKPFPPPAPRAAAPRQPMPDPDASRRRKAVSRSSSGRSRKATRKARGPAPRHRRRSSRGLSRKACGVQPPAAGRASGAAGAASESRKPNPRRQAKAGEGSSPGGQACVQEQARPFEMGHWRPPCLCSSPSAYDCGCAQPSLFGLFRLRRDAVGRPAPGQQRSGILPIRAAARSDQATKSPGPVVPAYRFRNMTTIPAEKLDKLVSRWETVQGALAARRRPGKLCAPLARILRARSDRRHHQSASLANS